MKEALSESILIKMGERITSRLGFEVYDLDLTSGRPIDPTSDYYIDLVYNDPAADRDHKVRLVDRLYVGSRNLQEIEDQILHKINYTHQRYIKGEF